ncbi:MAG: hypothetical protein KAQ62_21135, partial [Cyclobacteriaceae bacterium]|nr:hypothetical protein [Cyclobacteriaceae bacterium]
VKEHYDKHLANFYSWMVGDFDQKRSDFQDFLENNNIYPTKSKVAIDLGNNCYFYGSKRLCFHTS